MLSDIVPAKITDSGSFVWILSMHELLEFGRECVAIEMSGLKPDEKIDSSYSLLGLKSPLC